MRSIPMGMFLASTDPVITRVRDAPGALIIQNDGDEIAAAKPLLHLKHCEVKTGEAQIMLPGVFYKHNTNWPVIYPTLPAQSKWQAANLGSPSLREAFGAHWWIVGPTVVHISEVKASHSVRPVRCT